MIKEGFFAICEFSPNVKSLVAFSSAFTALHGLASHSENNFFFYNACLVVAYSITKTVSKTKDLERGLADKLSTVILIFALLLSFASVVTDVVSKRDFSYAVIKVFAVLASVLSPAFVTVTALFYAVASKELKKHGVTVNNINAIGRLGKVKDLIIEEEGIVTERKYELYDIYSAECDRRGMLSSVFSIETHFSHPIAKAIAEAACGADTEYKICDSCHEISGKGVCGSVDGDQYLIGTKRLMREKGILLSDAIANLKCGNRYPLYVSKNGELCGALFFDCKTVVGCNEILKKI